mgnify:FL=1
MAVLKFKNADAVRLAITQQQQRDILAMYTQLAKDIKKQLATMNKTGMQRASLVLLQRNINTSIQTLNDDIKNNIVSNMRVVADSVVEDARAFLLRAGFAATDVNNAFNYVPRDIVRSLYTGNIYDTAWTLDKAIWNSNKKTQDMIQQIIAYDTAAEKSAYDIATDIAQYVDASSPSNVIKSWRYDKNGNKIKDTFRFGKVDYNAQRLARTMVSHAYQQSFMAVNEKDPFVIGYRWLTSNFHGRVCPICTDRATKDAYGLGAGIFPKDALPMDHPNGMCTYEAVTDDDMNTIAKRIADWYKAPSGTYPDIDAYAADF